MSRLRLDFLSLIGWLFLGLVGVMLLAVEIPLWVLTLPLGSGRQRHILLRLQQAALRLVVAGHPLWDITVEGHESLPAPPFILCANHRSYADVFALSLLRAPLRFVAKAQLFRVPVLGWLMRMTGQISVRRGDKASGQNALDESASVLDQGMSIAIFPEGRRAPTDGAPLGAFKLGAFRLMLSFSRGYKPIAVVPVVITGTEVAWPRGTWRLARRAAMHVKVLPAVWPSTEMMDAPAPSFSPLRQAPEWPEEATEVGASGNAQESGQGENFDGKGATEAKEHPAARVSRAARMDDPLQPPSAPAGHRAGAGTGAGTKRQGLQEAALADAAALAMQVRAVMLGALTRAQRTGERA